MRKVYFDASVIIAAILSPDGGSAKCIECTRMGLITGITSLTVIDEVLNHTEKIKTSPMQIHRYIDQSGILVRRRITIREAATSRHEVDSEDAHVIAGALLTNCTHLATLDKKHLLNPKIRWRFKPLRIISPKELLNILF